MSFRYKLPRGFNLNNFREINLNNIKACRMLPIRYAKIDYEALKTVLLVALLRDMNNKNNMPQYQPPPPVPQVIVVPVNGYNGHDYSQQSSCNMYDEDMVEDIVNSVQGYYNNQQTYYQKSNRANMNYIGSQIRDLKNMIKTK